MKTILVSSFHILISRNILLPGIPKRLAGEGIRVVILVPDFKLDYFIMNFSAPGVVFEGVKANVFSRSFAGLLFKRLSQAMLNTETAKIRTKYKFVVERKRFYYLGFVLPARLLGRSRVMVSLVRFLDQQYSSRRDQFHALIRQYRPDLVVSTDVNNENDVALLQAARENGVRTAGIVRSWDNLTNFFMRVLPDRLAVANEIMRDQAIRYQGMRPEALSVIGIPHYDRYLNGPTASREEFFQSLGLDPRRRLIVYVPVADYRVRENDIDRFMVGLLAGTGENILVRMPPAATVTLDADPAVPNVHFDNAGVRFRVKGESEIGKADDDRLINMLTHCDVVVSGPGTLNIDAAVFDKPLILVDFYPSPRSFWEGIKEYRFIHIGYILRSGGARLVHSAQELLDEVMRSIENPSRDAAGRAHIREEQCYRLDGRSTERAVAFITGALNRRIAP